MSLLDFTTLPQLILLTDEVTKARVALESIATSLLRLTELPAQAPLPDKPIGASAVGSYGQALMDADSPEDFWERLRKQGLSDADVESFIMKQLTREPAQETTE